MATQANRSSLEHPRMGVVLAFSGLVGIAIPLMDHNYILLGYLLCWGSALAICMLYYPQWRLASINHFSTKKYKKKLDGRDHLFAPIFVVIYLAAPIVIYSSSPKSDNYVTFWGPPPVYMNFVRHDYNSFTGARVSIMKVDGKLVGDNIGYGYKLIGVCFHHYNPVDPKDEQNISRSGPYDITPQEIDIEIPWSQKVLEELIDGMSGTTYVLLAIPSDKASESFHTVRDAVALGAKVLAGRGGPP